MNEFFNSFFEIGYSSTRSCQQQRQKTKKNQRKFVKKRSSQKLENQRSWNFAGFISQQNASKKRLGSCSIPGSTKIVFGRLPGWYLYGAKLNTGRLAVSCWFRKKTPGRSMRWRQPRLQDRLDAFEWIPGGWATSWIQKSPIEARGYSTVENSVIPTMKMWTVIKE